MRTLSQRQRMMAWSGVGFIAPWLAGFLILQLVPMLLVFYYSVTNYSFGPTIEFIGLRNYVRAITRDELFRVSLGNTLYYIGISVPLVIVSSFLVANLLNQDIRGRGIYRLLVYLPTVVPLTAVSIVWMWLLDTRVGIINHMLGWVGIRPIRWLTDPAWSKPALILMRTWIIGQPVIVFMAGLKAIPTELLEGATIDGAGPFRRLVSIVVPLMSPTILYNFVVTFIFAFQTFVQAFVITQGGPVNSTLFYMLHLYREGFGYLRIGYASMLAVVLFLIILSLTIIVFAVSRRWVHYEYEGK